MYNSGTPGHVPGTNFATDGSTGTYDPTSDIPFGNGDEIQVVLSYNGSVLTETLTDITDGANYGDTYSINYTENLAQILGFYRRLRRLLGRDRCGSLDPDSQQL